MHFQKSRCVRCDLRASVVNFTRKTLTTEAQRTLRWHREELKSVYYRYFLLGADCCSNHRGRSRAASQFSSSAGSFLPSTYSLYSQGSPTAKTAPPPNLVVATITSPLCCKSGLAGGVSERVEISLTDETSMEWSYLSVAVWIENLFDQQLKKPSACDSREHIASTARL